MSDYPTDLAEVVAGILAIPMTDDAVDEAETDAELFEEIQEYYPMIPFADMALVRRLERLCQKYPKEAKIRNHLSAAYESMGRTKKSHQVCREIFRDFPDYLFARVNEARFLLDEGKLQEAGELLGPRLSLEELQPETEVFHLSEIRSFYHSVALYHLHNGRDELADGIAKCLIELHPDEHPALEGLRRRIELERIQKNIQRMTDESARMIRVKERKEERNFSKELPALNHGELEVLYRSGYDLGEEKLAEILALPRATLIVDLESILQDCFSRTAHFRKLAKRSGNEEKLYGALHAMYLLGELEARESLPLVLQVLESPGKTLEFWFGEMMEQDLWQPVYQLVGDDLEKITDWFLAPGRSAIARNLVSAAVVQGAILQPERADAIFAWQGGLLSALLEVAKKDNVYDTRVAQKLVAQILDFCRKEHHALVVKFSEQKDFHRSFLGDLEEMESDLFSDPPKVRAIKQELLSVADRYCRSSQAEESQRDFDPAKLAQNLAELMPDSQLMRNFSEAQSSKPSSAGRNDPCPCGSGKKYKKCCL